MQVLSPGYKDRLWFENVVCENCGALIYYDENDVVVDGKYTPNLKIHCPECGYPNWIDKEVPLLVRERIVLKG